MASVLSNLNWAAWLYGLCSGFIGGGAGAVTAGFTVGMIDPEKFGFGGWNSVKLMFACFLVNGLISAFLYLKQHPLPDEKNEAAGVGK